MIAPLLALAAAGAAPCSPPPGWRALAASPARYIFFGEQHGTREAPATVGEVACALARTQPVLVGVELFSANNAALQAAWRVQHNRFAAELRRAMTDWRYGGGPASSALFAMLVRLHALRAKGAPIAVVAFNGARDQAQQDRFAAVEGQGKYEAMYAENVREAATAGNYGHVLVLVGNLHARKTPWVHGMTRVEPMAMRLAPPGDIVSLDLATSGGTAFNCQAKTDVPETAGPEAVECASHAYPATPGLSGRRGIVLRSADPAYDGMFDVGRISAALPVSL